MVLGARTQPFWRWLQSCFVTCGKGLIKGASVCWFCLWDLWCCLFLHPELTAVISGFS